MDWISVEDELPLMVTNLNTSKIGTQVIMTDGKTEEKGSMFYDHGLKRFESMPDNFLKTGIGGIENVTHWKSLDD